jgi:hypothetical protein
MNMIFVQSRCGFSTKAADWLYRQRLLEKLGKFTTGVGCLYIKTLQDVDKKILKELVKGSVKRMKQLST